MSLTLRERQAYAAGMDEPQTAPSQRSRTGWKLLLILPFVGLCFPQVYARATPTLFGFPFFYWYQFLWVVLASGLMALVYRKLRY